MPGYPAHGDPTHLDGTQLEVLTRIIIDDRNKVIAQVPFLVTAVLVYILSGHQGGNVENSCRVGDTGLGSRTGHLRLGLRAQVETSVSLQISLVFSPTALGSSPTKQSLEAGQPRAIHTLHDVIMPAVGELAILTTHIQSTQVHLVWLAVLELNEPAKACQKLCIPVGTVLI